MTLYAIHLAEIDIFRRADERCLPRNVTPSKSRFTLNVAAISDRWGLPQRCERGDAWLGYRSKSAPDSQISMKNSIRSSASGSSGKSS